MQETRMMIGIAGASGSGKSLLAKNILANLKSLQPSLEIAILNEDCYYLRSDDLSFPERELINYDNPESLEHSLLVEQLSALRTGVSVETPIYDYATHNRMEQANTLGPCDVLIVEGILILSIEQIRAHLDLCVYVDVPLETCLQRRLERDVSERGRSRESVLHQFETTVRPMFRQYIEPSKQFAHKCVTGGGENVDSIHEICDLVIESMKC